MENTPTLPGGTPITALHEHGLTWHQTTPLQRHGVATAERAAELVASHEKNPAASALSGVPSFGPSRIAKLTAAVRAWTAASGT
uniref:hypothetical protein n=1 Tax=Amycolatopsis sp. CA-096443 TaxID=3239919 RepID=UPI003F495B40